MLEQLLNGVREGKKKREQYANKFGRRGKKQKGGEVMKRGEEPSAKGYFRNLKGTTQESA